MRRDHYATLEIQPGAGRREILKARNRLLREHHPDLNPGNRDAAKEKTIEILHAAEVLLDPRSRDEYDHARAGWRGETAAPPGRGAPPPRPGYRKRPRFVYDCPACGHSAVNPYGQYCMYCGHGRASIKCPECGHDNFNAARNYCMYCGAGIGENPRPFTVEQEKYDIFSRRAAARGMYPRAPVLGQLMFVAAAVVVIFGAGFLFNFAVENTRYGAARPSSDYIFYKHAAEFVLAAVILAARVALRNRYDRWW